MHKHENNEDAYIIVTGEGIFTDSAGKETPVKAGDITIAKKGESHALKNTGKEPLVFLDVVGAQQ
jgi:mannose-6-phosphate isomerase-like protein (cupin superfamily)